MPVVTKYVSIRQPKGLVASFAPGEELPEWAIPLITNPAVLAGSPAGDATPDSDSPAGVHTPSPADPTPPALSRQKIVDKAKSLGIKANQSNEALLAAIAEKEREQNPPAAPTTDGSQEDGETSRSDLEAKARELGIEFTAETSEAELELAIASTNPQE